MKPEYKKRMLVRIVERGVLGQALRNLSILRDLRRRTFNLSPGRYFSSAGQAPYWTVRKRDSKICFESGTCNSKGCPPSYMYLRRLSVLRPLHVEYYAKRRSKNSRVQDEHQSTQQPILRATMPCKMLDIQCFD